jgi:hypothetical protein
MFFAMTVTSSRSRVALAAARDVILSAAKDLGPCGMLLVVGSLLTGCVHPTSAPPLAPLPFATDTSRLQRVADGVWYRYLYAPSGPWAIHVLDIDLSRCNRIVAVKGGDAAAGRTKTTQLLAGLARQTTDGQVVAGANADFFSLANGTPVGPLVVDGRVISSSAAEPFFAVDASGHARIGTVSGDDAAAMRSFRQAVGGHPFLVRDSAVTGDVDTNGNAGFRGRNPRTVIGIARSGRRVLLAVIDGRQKPYSDGASLRESADILRALGARDVLNLDGGGSSTLVYAEPGPNSSSTLRVANRPSDAQGERAVGDALAIVNTCTN